MMSLQPLQSAASDDIMHDSKAEDLPLQETTSSHNYRNVFLGIPVLGFFRQKRRVDFETTQPLWTNESNISYQATTELESIPTRSSTTPRRTGKELWGILREHVRHETFHIEDLRSKSERVGTKEARNFEDIDLPYEFSVLNCFFALVVYLGISIVAYSFVFEHWTPIEVRILSSLSLPYELGRNRLTDSALPRQSMYFACVSFTTIGKSCR